MTLCRHFVITGLVQGVCFRANTQSQAQRLGLTGWVRNRPDGRVEAVACGPAPALQAFEAWLWQGPAAAAVDRVEAGDWAGEAFTGFQVRR